MLKLSITVALFSLCANNSIAAMAAAAKPNFIVVFVDDQGYQDLGCFGSPNIKTPNIDQMAREGIRFTDFYSAASVCTPSRASLLTGCYPERVGNVPVLFPDRRRNAGKDQYGLNPDETTIAEMLKSEGYSTSCIGKWHLGHEPEFLPINQGFDSYYGIPYSNDMWIDPQTKRSKDIVLNEGVTLENIGERIKYSVPLMRNDEIIEYPVDQGTLTKKYTQEAIRFIKTQKDQPFFLYLAHSMPHIPLYASPAFEGKSDCGLYGDCIEEIDWSCGELFKTLQEQGIAENTLIIYTTDNGPWNLEGNKTDKVKGNLNRKIGGSALPLRGYKFYRYEGGLRVPCVMHWPAGIPAGQVSSEVAGTIDLLPTFAALSGAKLPEKKIDGKSILPLMRGENGAKSPHAAYFYRTEAIRVGNWKFKKHKKGPQLFDLSKDISESNNVAADHPEIVEKLKKQLDDRNAELQKEARPVGRHKTPQKQAS